MAQVKRSKKAQHWNEAWVGFFDIYGFSALLRQPKSAEILLKLRAYQDSTFSILKKLPDIRYFIFSDSILFAVPSKHPHYDSFKPVSELVKLIYYEGIKNNFMLRGALTFGSVTISSHFILGDAVLRAVELEKEVAYPLAFVPTAELQHAGIEKETGVTLELIRTKKGIVGGMDLVSLPFDLLTKAVDAHLEETSTHGPQDVALVWYELRQRITTMSLLSEDRRNAQGGPPETTG